MIVQKKQRRAGAKMIYDIKFVDQNGNIGYISIFNSAFLASKVVEKSWYIIVGKPQRKFSKIIFSHPDIVPTASPEEETVEGDSSYNSGRIFPVYSEMQGIKPGRFAQKIWNNLDQVDSYFSEYLPEEFVKQF
jgi:RecG-like helicase